MAKLPLLKWRDAERLIEWCGFSFKHQKGSHRVYRNADGRVVSLPRRREIPRGTLQGLLAPLGITRRQFEDWYDSK